MSDAVTNNIRFENVFKSFREGRDKVLRGVSIERAETLLASVHLKRDGSNASD